jgi:hypothetical protein
MSVSEQANSRCRYHLNRSLSPATAGHVRGLPVPVPGHDVAYGVQKLLVSQVGIFLTIRQIE